MEHFRHQFCYSIHFYFPLEIRHFKTQIQVIVLALADILDLLQLLAQRYFEQRSCKAPCKVTVS